MKQQWNDFCRRGRGLWRWERMVRICREAFWVAFGQALMVGGALLGIRFLTEILEPAQYGELALGNTMALLLMYVFFSPLSFSTMRFYPLAKEAGDFPAFFRASRWFFFCSLGALAAAAALFLLVVLFWVGVKWALIGTIAMAFGAVSGTNYILLALQIAARQRRRVAFLQGADVWSRFFIAAALALSLGATSTMALLGYLLSALLLMGAQIHPLSKLLAEAKSAPSSAHGELDWQRKIISYASPFAIWGVFVWLQFSSDKWALARFATTKEVGLYAVLYQIGYYPISIVIVAILQLVMPIFFGIVGDAADKTRVAKFHAVSRKVLYFVVFLAVVCLASGYFMRELVFSIFVAEEYRGVSSLLPWMLLAGGLFACGQTAYTSLLSQTKTKALLAPIITTSLLGVVGNYAGACYFGIQGVVGAQIIFGCVYSAWMLRLLSRQRRNV